jgi:hypothetical protein
MRHSQPTDTSPDCTAHLQAHIRRYVVDGSEQINEHPRQSPSKRMNWLPPVNAMICRPLLAAAAACLLVSAVSHAQGTATQAQSESGDGIILELNKIEKSDKGCRAYVVVTNPTKTSYDAFKLDLVMFQKDGIVGRRFALDLSPVRPDKRSVKLFDLDGAQCDEIGSFLINDVMDCRTSTGPATDCLSRLKVKSLTKVEISK